jgi:hypothetical protein
MMMGALRRMYDTFAAQFAALPTTYLRLTGGTLRDGIDIARFDTTGCYNVNASWGFISDANVKRNIKLYECGLNQIERLYPVSYYYKPDAPFPSVDMQYGLIAQDVEDVIPEVVGEFNGLKTLQPTLLIYPLINACKELALQNAMLANRIEALEKRHV